jgi:ketosteroid isomerase-like protein
MKTAYLTVLICFLSTTASADPSGCCDRNLDAVQQKFSAFNRHDAAAIQGIFAADAVLHSPDYPELTGNAQIADTYRGIFAAIPDAQDDIQDLGASGDKVYVQFIMSGHLKGAQDKPLKVRIMSVYTLKDGHIVEDSTYYDRKAR